MAVILPLMHNQYSVLVTFLQILPRIDFDIFLVNDRAQSAREIIADCFPNRGRFDFATGKLIDLFRPTRVAPSALWFNLCHALAQSHFARLTPCVVTHGCMRVP